MEMTSNSGNDSLTVKHIGLCPGLNATRVQFYSQSTFDDVFNKVAPQKALKFLSHVYLKHLI